MDSSCKLPAFLIRARCRGDENSARRAQPLDKLAMSTRPSSIINRRSMALFYATMLLIAGEDRTLPTLLSRGESASERKRLS